MPRTMTNRERVLATLNHEQPDVVPYNIGFTQVAHARMVEYTGDPDFLPKLGNCLSGIRADPPDAWREVRPDIWQDQFGVQWDRRVDKDIGAVCNRCITRENVADYPFPDADDPARTAHFERVLAAKGDRFYVAPIDFSLFERAWTLAGMEELLAAMIGDHAFVHALLDRIVEFNLKIIEHVCAHDIDAVHFGDDWGHQGGLLMGPALWHEFIEPRIRAMYAAVHSGGKFVIIHSCGKVDSLFPKLIECGVDVFNPFQPEVMDVFEAKRRYGDRLCFYGGISTQRTLPYGTVAQVKDEVRRLLDVVGKSGGYIAAPAHAIPADAKPENVAAMIEVLVGQ
jgi:uroporphyrinogen decarboxylase